MKVDETRRLLIACCLAMCLGIASAQDAVKMHRVGVLIPNEAFLELSLFKQFKQALLAAGYVEGRNLIFDYASSDGHNDRFPQLVTDLASRGVDVIFSAPAPATRAARAVSPRVPVVFTIAADPVALGLIDSYEHPGGWFTGVTEESPDLPARRVELLKQLVPALKTIGVVWDADAFGEKVGLEMAMQARTAASPLGVDTELIAVHGPADIDAAFATAANAHVGALLVEPSPMFAGQYQRFVSLAAQRRIPALYPWSHFVQAGGLASLGADLGSMGQRAAGYVDKVLRGSAPSDLPVGRLEKSVLVINRKAARDLGLSVSAPLLQQATAVVE